MDKPQEFPVHLDSMFITYSFHSPVANNSQLRIVNAFRFCTKTMRPAEPPTSAQLFQPLITTSKPPMSEIDIYMHSKFNLFSHFRNDLPVIQITLDHLL